MLINMRNGLMAGKRLPYDAEVEYLESTGTQYIDIGSLPAGSTDGGTIDIEFYIEHDVGYRSIWGSGGYGTQAINLYFNSSIKSTDLTWCRGAYFTAKVFDVNKWFRQRFETASKTTLTITGDSGTLATHEFNNPVAGNYTLFKYSGSSYAGQEGLRIRSFRTTGCYGLRDFIPVRFTNEYGQTEGAMFDRANPTVGMNPDGSARTDGLYRNRGTGAFTYGNDI